MSVAVLSGKPITVVPATDAHLSQLIPVVRAGHERMANPYAADYTPERSVQLLAIVLPFPTTVLILALDGRRIVGYCWAEHLLDVRQLHVHELYLHAGYAIEPLWQALREEAGRRGCRRISALSYRPGSARAFARFGFVRKATFLVKEMS